MPDVTYHHCPTPQTTLAFASGWSFLAAERARIPAASYCLTFAGGHPVHNL